MIERTGYQQILIDNLRTLTFDTRPEGFSTQKPFSDHLFTQMYGDGDDHPYVIAQGLSVSAEERLNHGIALLRRQCMDMSHQVSKIHVASWPKDDPMSLDDQDDDAAHYFSRIRILLGKEGNDLVDNWLFEIGQHLVEARRESISAAALINTMAPHKIAVVLFGTY